MPRKKKKKAELTPLDISLAQAALETTIETALEYARQREAIDQQLYATYFLNGVRGGVDIPAQRARELLFRLISPEQRQSFEQLQEFTELKDGVHYILGRGPIRVVNAEGRITEMWCAMYMDLVWEDTVVAQLLHLRQSPETLRAMSNVIPTGRHEHRLMMRWRRADPMLDELLTTAAQRRRQRYGIPD